MAAGNFIPYDVFPYRLARQEWNYLSGNVKMALLANAYTPDTAAHNTFSDVSGDEITDADYSQQALTSKTITQDASNRTVFDADNVSFGTTVTISARYAVVYVDTGTAGTSYLMGYIDLNDGGSSEVSTTNSEFVVGFSAAGSYRMDP